MAPILWTTFHTDLKPTREKTLDVLLHPDCGILPLGTYVRSQHEL